MISKVMDLTGDEPVVRNIEEGDVPEHLHQLVAALEEFRTKGGSVGGVVLVGPAGPVVTVADNPRSKGGYLDQAVHTVALVSRALAGGAATLPEGVAACDHAIETIQVLRLRIESTIKEVEEKEREAAVRRQQAAQAADLEALMNNFDDDGNAVEPERDTIELPGGGVLLRERRP